MARKKKQLTEDERIAQLEREAMEAAARETRVLDAIAEQASEMVARAAQFPELPHTPSRDVLEVSVPSVWREAGYMVIAYKIWAGEVHYFSLLNGERAEKPAAFLARMSCKLEEVCPHQLALNLLARLRMGTCRCAQRLKGYWQPC
jgi:hypothetical protein